MSHRGFAHNITALFFLAALLVLPPVILFSLHLESRSSSLSSGDHVPSASVLSMDGDSLALSDAAHGRPHLLLIVSATCDHCKKELTFLRSVAATHSDSLLLVSVSLSDSQTTAQLAAEAGFPLFRDAWSQVRERFRVRAVPALYIVSADGRITEKRIGAVPESVLIAAAESVSGQQRKRGD